MSSISSLLARLKHESKKNVTKMTKEGGVEYRMDTVEVHRTTFLVKRVAVVNQLGYDIAWVMDNQTQSCMRCDSQFGVLTWRHHCRACGFVVCQTCGDKKINYPAFQEESPAGSRVCRPCYSSHTVKRRPSKTPSAKDEVPVDVSVVVEAEKEPAPKDVIPPAVAPIPPSEPAVERVYAPKLRPSMPVEAAAPATAPQAAGFGVPATQSAPVTLVDTSKAAPSAGISASQPFCPAPAPLRKSQQAKAAPQMPVEPSNRESRDEFTPLPVFEETDLGSSLNSSILSTGAKTARNTAINATLVAPPPKKGQTCTAPEIFSPVRSNMRDLDYLDLQTPDSTGSIGYGEVQVDFTKFGTPETQKQILENARNNVIWEAPEDDLSSTNGSSVAPTPTSGISGTTNGGAGVGYIRSPWDNNSFSPYGSQQKPRRLVPNTGSSSVGRSGKQRSSSASRVRFADSSFSAEAGSDIVDAGPEASPPSLPLTHQQLQIQQEKFRVQAAAAGGQGAGRGGFPSRVDLRGAMNDVENDAPGARNRIPTGAPADATRKGASAPANRQQPQVQQAVNNPAQKNALPAAAANARAQQYSSVHGSLPSLNKPTAGRAPR